MLAGAITNRSMMNGTATHSDPKECDSDEKYDYESSIRKLHTLVSNAEVIASKRATRDFRRASHVNNIIKFIQRSGLTREEVDNMSMIHVSGTKGKGSTCAFCERILHSKGYKTGLFSSPHLVEIRERIRINGRPVSKELYASHFWKVYNRLKATKTDEEESLPAYFAFNMILSLHIFAAEGVDVSIMEVGIGGQYDSTNFIQRPAVCGVTSLGLDHTSLLGNTLEEIAWNKAGIFKTGCPAVVVQQKLSPMEVLLDRAKERQSALYLAMPIDEDILKRERIHLGIMGNKQRENAGLALQLANMWEARHGRGGDTEPVMCNVSDVTCIEDIPVLKTLHIDQAAAQGLSSCVWPGRAQVVRRPKVTYYLDGAHTKESIQVCSHWFKETADKEVNSIKGKVARVLVFNVTGERKPGPLLECLTDCNFDAACFPTNSVSTVESFNRIDQHNPMYTSKAMLDKTEDNRACWEGITCGLATTGHSLGSMGVAERTVTNGPERRELGGDGGGGNRDLESTHSGNLAPPTAVLASPGCDKKENNNNNKLIDVMSVSSSMMPNGFGGEAAIENEARVHHHHHHHHYNTTGIDDVSFNSDRSKSSACVDREEESVKSSVNNGVCTGDGNHSEKRSHSFPSVLQALAWSTCGKDTTVDVRDPNAHLPPVVSVMEGADHIQVLVTGSLLLVGAVLDVVDPNMNG